MHVSQDTVVFAEQLLDIVKALASVPAGNGHSTLSPLAVYKAQGKAQELCSKVLQGVLGPSGYTLLLGESCQESSALGLITSLGIPDIIGSGQKTVAELAEATGAEQHVLGVALSCLLKHNYFKEVGAFDSKVYRNNEFSEILKKDHPQTINDAIGFICDEGFKSTAYLYEASKQETASPKQKGKPASNIAFGFEENIFTWMSENGWRGARMGNAMQQMHRMANGNVVTDYPWNEQALPIVDVGGGIGSLEMALLKTKEHANLDFIIFDIDTTVANGKKIWAGLPGEISSHITYQHGNFLAPTLEETRIPQGKPTYLIRHVLHDWRDEEVITILKAVRAAMLANKSTPPPKLLVCEMLVREDSQRFVYTTSMQLLALNNGITRTEGHMVDLIQRAGYDVKKTHEMRALDFIIEATPRS